MVLLFLLRELCEFLNRIRISLLISAKIYFTHECTAEIHMGLHFSQKQVDVFKCGLHQSKRH